MKARSEIRYSVIAVVTVAALLFAAGCRKQEQPTTQPMTSDAGDAPKADEALDPTVEAAPEAAAVGTTDQAGTAVAADNRQAQTLIEKARELVRDQKYQDALTVVQQVSALRLTPDQQRLVNGMKVQIRSALGGKAVPGAATTFGTRVSRGAQTQE
jgi:hypothetical protein